MRGCGGETGRVSPAAFSSSFLSNSRSRQQQDDASVTERQHQSLAQKKASTPGAEKYLNKQRRTCNCQYFSMCGERKLFELFTSAPAVLSEANEKVVLSSDSAFPAQARTTWEGDVCPSCGREIHRSHRSVVERLWCARAWNCRGCGERFRERRPSFQAWASCPRCGTARITTLRKRDPVDRMHHGALSFMSRLLGASLYHCNFCRLQFYDLRRPRTSS